MQSRMSCIQKKNKNKNNKRTQNKTKQKNSNKKFHILWNIQHGLKKKKKRKDEVQHIKPLIHSIAKTEAFTVSLWESSYTSL